MSGTRSICSVGHSTLPLAAFIALLRENGIRRVADVRSFPASRANPQFNRDRLPVSLAGAEIGYAHLASLGGRRSRRKDLAPGTSPNGGWENESFRNYADYALTPPFREGLAELLVLAELPTAIMCAEAVWWRCHRRIVADYLVARGWTVLQVVPPDPPEPHALTPFARVLRDGSIIYPLPEERSHDAAG
ncbi:MAG: DUF488 domain-containing protein [Chthonomonadales bacterium]|nr:DUF488 domain-containing protein [Chthonomonadales bacterium]